VDDAVFFDDLGLDASVGDVDGGDGGASEGVGGEDEEDGEAHVLFSLVGAQFGL